MRDSINNKGNITKFAPAERSSADEINRQVQFFASIDGLYQFVRIMPAATLILNYNRQVVYANNVALKLLGLSEQNGIYGLRPGEIVNCIHSDEEPGGCGTSSFCDTCGAVKVILTSLRGEEEVQECRITCKNGDSIDLRVWGYPLKYQDEDFVFFVLDDISHEKRRYMLERIFFHDILNTAGGLYSFMEILKDYGVKEFDNVKDDLYILSRSLIDEIQAQRLLVSAEHNDLSVTLTTFDSLELLREIIDVYQDLPLAEKKHISLQPEAQSISMTSDRTLLSRVLVNMVKNALEASDEGDTVTMGCESADKDIIFSVHNPGYMLPDTQKQIFQRSFSTKGAGRGLGTYSIRLFSERFLKGKVAFTSTEKNGTTFTARFPL